MYQGTKNAPSTKVVVPFFVLSAISWMVVLLFTLFHAEAVLYKPFFNGDMLVITHIMVLGFVTSVIIGALFQLLPVIFLQSLYSEKLGKVIFYLLTVGTIGLCTSFYNGINGLGLTIFGTVVNLAVVLFVVNIWNTIGNSTENPIAKRFVRTSAVWLLLTTLIGLILSINFLYPFLRFSHLELLKVHAHIGIFGWFIFLIIGVSSVLIPMFLLVHKLNKKPLEIAYWLLMGGIIIGVLGKLNFLNNFYLMELGFILVGGGLISYFLFIYEIYRKRIRKKLAYDLRKSVVSYLPMLLAIVIGLLFLIGVPSKINLSALYIIVILIGFVTTLILGMFYKTLPFIMWLKIYKPHVGKEKTLLPKDLHDEDILKLHYYFHLIGFVILILSLIFNLEFIFYIGISLLFLAAILFFINVMLIVLHKRVRL